MEGISSSQCCKAGFPGSWHFDWRKAAYRSSMRVSQVPSISACLMTHTRTHLPIGSTRNASATTFCAIRPAPKVSPGRWEQICKRDSPTHRPLPGIRSQPGRRAGRTCHRIVPARTSLNQRRVVVMCGKPPRARERGLPCAGLACARPADPISLWLLVHLWPRNCGQ
jgi:hypothetical protein